MTVKQLKEAIENLPNDMDVFVEAFESDFAYSILETTAVADNMPFREEDSGEVLAYDNVLILIAHQ